jgi:hypothetical protein
VTVYPARAAGDRWRAVWYERVGGEDRRVGETDVRPSRRGRLAQRAIYCQGGAGADRRHQPQRAGARQGPGGERVAGMRVIVRRERPHPGAQLRFTDTEPAVV